jgi:hypothetical protein
VGRESYAGGTKSLSSEVGKPAKNVDKRSGGKADNPTCSHRPRIDFMKTIYKTRKKQLEYYLKSAKTDLAKMYWYGRLDELWVFRSRYEKENSKTIKTTRNQYPKRSRNNAGLGRHKKRFA